MEKILFKFLEGFLTVLLLLFFDLAVGGLLVWMTISFGVVFFGL